MNRLQHDAAWDAASQALDVVSMTLSEENRQKVMGEFYLIILKAITLYLEKMERQDRRLRPEVSVHGR